MALVRQLLLLPLLAPLLAVVLVGAFNPRPPVSLRLLTWTSPALPIGVWLMVASAGGAGLSALATGLALRTGPRRLQRQVRRPVVPADGGADPGIPRWREPAAPPQAPWSAPSAGPTRPAGEASPTVAVPYRVIRKGREPASASAVEAHGQAPAVAVGDDWDRAPSDDW